MATDLHIKVCVIRGITHMTSARRRRRSRRRLRRWCNRPSVLLRAEVKGVVVDEERRVRGEQAEGARRGHLIGAGDVEPSEPRAGDRKCRETPVGEAAAAVRAPGVSNFGVLGPRRRRHWVAPIGHPLGTGWAAHWRVPSAWRSHGLGGPVSPRRLGWNQGGSRVVAGWCQGGARVVPGWCQGGAAAPPKTS